MIKIITDNLGIIGIGIFLILLLTGFFGFVIFITLSKRLREYVLDDSGKLSMGRLICFLSVFFFIISSAFNLLSKGTFPDIPLTLAGLVAALYGINKFSPTVPFMGGGDHEEHGERR